MGPIVFFSRCKPQDQDIIDLVLDEKRVFIGHPMARAGIAYDALNLAACMVNPSCPDDEWEMARNALPRKFPQHTQNRNLIRQVGIGSIVLVPRPMRGVVYCGRIASDFELVDRPPWYARYMEMRGESDSEETWHAADVSQSWQVNKFVPIALPRLPAWIRRSLFGRSTYGVIHGDELMGDPHAAMTRIIDVEGFETRTWTLDVGIVERRMLEDLTPTSFEHLMVSLLQLEHEGEAWTHAGGSGDGGVDGVGADSQGRVAGLLQCKWQYWGEPVLSDGGVWGGRDTPFRHYLACLRYPAGCAPQGIIFLNRPAIAGLVVKHHARLPQAFGMRVGPGVESAGGSASIMAEPR